MTDTRFSDDLIVQYLLGELPENKQVEIEDRAFQDPNLFNNITAVEHDLIDDYVAGDLPSNKLKRFESHFLASAERRKKVAFAKSLQAIIAKPQQEPARNYVREPSRFTSLFAFLVRPATAYAFAAAAVILFVIGSWLMINSMRLRSEVAHLRQSQETQSSQQKQLEIQINDQRVRNEELAAQLERERQDHPITQAANERERAISPIIAALTLHPGLSRDSNKVSQLRLAKDVATVRLNVGIDPHDTYNRFSVAVRKDGRVVFAQNKVAARDTKGVRAIPLNIPARLLVRGRYEVSLKGITDNGSFEDVGYYYFDVVRK